jgi:hypothetical protein
MDRDDTDLHGCVVRLTVVQALVRAAVREVR